MEGRKEFAQGNLFRGHIVDVENHRIIDGEMTVEKGCIASIRECSDIASDAPYFIPGFVDSHVHVESSMMVPYEFGRVAMKHGTVAAVCDPHEIANVLGVQGVEFMLESASLSPFHFFFGCPSCVPSCGGSIETSGATLGVAEVQALMARPDIHFLAEMMNYPGVLGNDPGVMAKIGAAQEQGKPVDGHAPGVVGQDRQRYASAGISTDHECATIEEGRACLASGMNLLIREGSAAKDFDSLIPLLREKPGSVMFCTDDCHPADFLKGHINQLVARALSLGYDVFDVLSAASVNPVRHYRLPVGLLRQGDKADFIVVSDLTPAFRVLATYLDGVEYQETAPSPVTSHPNRFQALPLREEDLEYPLAKGQQLHVIGASDGSLLTEHLTVTVDDVSAPLTGLNKIVVYNRYQAGKKPQIAYIRGFGITNGAMAASIAHDSHNIVAIGSDDAKIAQAINKVIEMQGGGYAMNGQEESSLALPIAGLMSSRPGQEIAQASARLEETIRRAGCPLHSPFITMAFMALPVIPFLKLTDVGLFDSLQFRFVEQ